LAVTSAPLLKITCVQRKCYIHCFYYCCVKFIPNSAVITFFSEPVSKVVIDQLLVGRRCEISPLLIQELSATIDTYRYDFINLSEKKHMR
jgi:hypothetical protein